MSVELAVISGLRHEIKTNLGLVREYTTTAGEDVNAGDLVKIGTDGNAYLKYRPNKSEIIDKAQALIDNTQMTRFDKLYDNVYGSNSFVIPPTVETANGYLGVASTLGEDGGNNYNTETLFYVYPDSSGNSAIVTQSVYNAPVRDTYNNRGRWRHYNGFLQKIDNTNHILYEIFYTDYYDGSNWHYETHVYYRNVTLDETNKTITISDSTQLLNVAKTGTANDWHFNSAISLFAYDSSTAYFVFPGNTEVARFAVDSSNSVSVAVDTTNATNATTASYFALYVDDGTTKGYIWSNGTTIYGITANNATDATKLRDIATTDPDYNMQIVRNLDTNLVLFAQGADNTLYIIKYNPDGTAAFVKKITCTNFNPAAISRLNYYRNITTPYAYKEADGSYTATLNTTLFIADEELGVNNYINYVVKITTDSSGNYYAEKLYETRNNSIQNQSPVTKFTDNYSIAASAFITADHAAGIEVSDVYLDTGVNVATFNIPDLFAKTAATAGNPVTIATTTTPIPMTINPGEVKGNFVGVSTGVALQIDKGEK